MEKIQQTFMYDQLGDKIWDCDDDRLGWVLRETDVDLKDMAIVFYSKLARWSDEKLYEKINNAFKEWLGELKTDAKKMYAEMDKEDREGVAKIVAQLKRIKEDNDD